MKGGTGSNWQIDGGSGSLYPNGFNSANAYTSDFVRVRATSFNECGNGQEFTFYLQNGYGGYGYRMASSGAGDQLTVTFDYKEMAEDLLDYIALYDDKKNTLASFDKKDKPKGYFKDRNSVDLDISKVKRGIYFLHVKLGDKISQQQVEIGR